jgi:hypothetical protein
MRQAEIQLLLKSLFGLNFVYNYGVRKHEARAEGSKEFFDAPQGHVKRIR